MIMPFIHPRLATLIRFADAELAPAASRRVARHLEGCPRCQDALRFRRRVAREASDVATEAPSPKLLERVLASRAAGDRGILLAAALDAPRPTRERRVARAVSVAAGLLLALLVATRVRNVEAVSDRSELTLRPVLPAAGERVEVQYRPAATLFSGADSVVLRGRLRSPGHPQYDHSDIPVEAVAVLRRNSAGVYHGAFRLPDSVVFAALAVEDFRAEQVDDDHERFWEVMVRDRPGIPSFDALEQRLSDMMGRSWEEAFASARRLTELYPTRLRAWHLRAFFERSLYGSAAADTMESTRQERALTLAAKDGRALPTADVGSAFFQAWSAARSSRATADDSADARYWRRRLADLDPRHPLLVQAFVVELRQRHRDDPRLQLDTLESAYRTMRPLKNQARFLLSAASDAAARVGDRQAQLTWEQRAFEGRSDSALAWVVAATGIAAVRLEAMEALRNLLAEPSRLPVPRRTLGTSAREHARAIDRQRRSPYLALGRALLAEGKAGPAADTLRRGAGGGWFTGHFTELAEALAGAGDTTASLALGMRVAVTPEISRSVTDSIVAAATRRLGVAAVDSIRRVARAEMRETVLGESVVRPLRGTPRVSRNGIVQSLADLSSSEPIAVILWSRNCGAALAQLATIAETVERMAAEGRRALFVVVDAPSPEIDAYLAEKAPKLVPHYDHQGSTRNAFSAFGTPSYYVLDAARRVRFRPDFPSQIPLYLEALQPK